MGDLHPETDQSVKVRIVGREYTIRGHGNKQYLEELAQFINDKANEIKEKTSVVSTLDVMTLTLLNVADELLQLRKKEKRRDKEQEGKTEGSATLY